MPVTLEVFSVGKVKQWLFPKTTSLNLLRKKNEFERPEALSLWAESMVA